MAAQKVHVELVTPEKLLFSTEVDMVVVPGTEGDFGVLPKHAPMISSLRNGIITTFGDDTGDKKIFVAGGFVEVTEERCTIIAEEAVLVQDIQKTLLDARLQKADHDLKRVETDKEKFRIQKEIAVVKAQLAIVEGKIAA